MKKIITSAILIAMMTCGIANAEKLQLPQGETLDLSEKVGVYDAENSFTVKMIRKEIDKKETQEKIKESLLNSGVTTNVEEATNTVTNIIKNTRIYQLRSNTKENYYQGILVSVYVKNSDKTKLKQLQENLAKESENIDFVGMAVKSYIKNIPLDIKEKDMKKSEKGIEYTEKETKADFENADFSSDLYTDTIIIKGKEGSTYSVFNTTQVAAKYFRPFIEQALRGMEK
jgi:hypothetical protein